VVARTGLMGHGASIDKRAVDVGCRDGGQL
jgi:hypothetical protein